MTIVWRGVGILVPIFAFASLVIAELVSESIFSNEQYYQENPWVMSVGFLLGAVAIAVTTLIFKDEEPREIIDQNSGEHVFIPGKRHDFFHIPMKVWSIILVFIAIASYVGSTFG